jgi:hypothetical protein
METSWGWNLAIVFSTLIGPILAVQAQKWLDARRDLERRRLAVFHALMRNRASPLTPEFVNALNSVPLEFHGKTRSLADVRSAWRQYMEHMGKQGMTLEVWAPKRLELLVSMLQKMGDHLDYGFDAVELEREVYSPMAHGQVENEQNAIRQGLAALLSGERSLPMDVKTWPTDTDAVTRHQALQDALLAWLRGETAPQVRLDQGAGKQQQ